MTAIQPPPCVGSLDDAPSHDPFMDLWCITAGSNNSTVLHLVADFRRAPRRRTPRGTPPSHRYGAMHQGEVPLLHALRVGHPLCAECLVGTHPQMNHPDSPAYLPTPWQ
jgi:hypothetical protein